MEIIPNGDFVFRLIPKHFIREFKISPSGFMLHPHDEHKLSVDWEKYSTPEASLARCGATLKKDKEVFKDHRSYEICKLKSCFIRSLNGIVDVLFDPIFNNPEHLGQPNNPSHSL